MIPLKDFDEFLEDGTVRKITPDKNRANYLKEEAGKRLKFLSKLKASFGIRDDNANYIVENCYDALSELIRARMLEAGYSASGPGAHEAEVAFLRKLSFSDADIIFLNELRYFRNGILYYGKSLDRGYALKADSFTVRIFPELS